MDESEAGRLESSASQPEEELKQEQLQHEEESVNEDEISTAGFSLEGMHTNALRDGVRHVMRHVPSSVVVITAAAREDGQPIPLGSAISSFNTVTLDPPTVSFNIRYPSRTLDAIRAAHGLFRVHFLEGQKRGGRIAEVFTLANTTENFKIRRQEVRVHLPPRRDISNATDSMAPQIQDTAVVAAMECEMTQEMTVADHIILVARINSLEKNPELESTILYHDGKYKRNDGAVVFQHLGSHRVLPANEAKEVGIYWKYPLFHGEAERQDMKEQLKSYIKSNPHLLKMDLTDAAVELHSSLLIPRGAFGFNMALLVAECRADLGLEPGFQRDWEKDAPVVNEFYGRLTPGAIKSIVERVRKLARIDASCLDLDLIILLSALGVHPTCTGYLASEILEPLRDEGFVAPFEAKARPPAIRRVYTAATLEDTEQLEFRLREFLRTRTYNDIRRMTPEDLEKQVGGPGPKARRIAHIKRVRDRIITEVFPAVFAAPNIDIGPSEVYQEEARVVVARIIDFFGFNKLLLFRRNISLPTIEILRRVGVHPMVSGVDVEFLIGKLVYMHRFERDPDALLSAVQEMLNRHFTRSVSLSDLESRVKQLVQKAPLRVVKWGPADLLAAMGLRHGARAKTPVARDRPQRLRDGHILPMLIAKELKNFYGKGTDEENAAIADFLKTQYKYDVHMPQPIRDTSEPDEKSRSSDEEMEEAMQQSLNVHVMHSEKAMQQLEEARREGPPATSGRQNGTRWKRIRMNGSGKEADDNQWTDWGKETANKEANKPLVTQWTAYRIDGEKKNVAQSFRF